ncbi:Ig domain-containing protein [Mycolicibacterium novocastrense]|nr:Ig domain-containing protein [Mycolicibacterium novocastrense]
MATLLAAPTSGTDPNWNIAGTYTATEPAVLQSQADISPYLQSIPAAIPLSVGDEITFDIDVAEVVLGSLITWWEVRIRRTSDWATVASYRFTANKSSGSPVQRVTLTHTATVAADYYIMVASSGYANGAAARFSFRRDTFNVSSTATPPPVPPTITTAALPALTEGSAVDTTITATGDPPISYAVSAGSLPAGLALSTAGEISGTPTTPGPYSVTVAATNAAGTDTETYSGTVAPAPVPPAPAGGHRPMILREKVVLGLGGGRDENGQLIPARNVVYRAAVAPLSSEEMSDRGRDPSSVAYRVTLPPPAPGDTIESTSTIAWRGAVYQVLGKPMLYTIGGRLHHIEVIAVHATG